jgi:hypothetical protein
VVLKVACFRFDEPNVLWLEEEGETCARVKINEARDTPDVTYPEASDGFGLFRIDVYIDILGVQRAANRFSPIL